MSDKNDQGSQELPDSPSYLEVASSWPLWQEYCDPNGQFSEAEFGDLSVGERMDILNECFGPEMTARERPQREYALSANDKGALNYQLQAQAACRAAVNERYGPQECARCGNPSSILHVPPCRPVLPVGTPIGMYHCPDCSSMVMPGTEHGKLCPACASWAEVSAAEKAPLAEAPVAANEHYFTFGQAHVHRVNGKTFDKDSVAVIRAPTHEEARAIAFELFGPEFCTSYERREDVAIQWFPRGFIAAN